MHAWVISMLLDVKTYTNNIQSQPVYRMLSCGCYTEQISYGLRDFFDLSIVTGAIPGSWLMVRISPINTHKKETIVCASVPKAGIRSTKSKILDPVILMHISALLEKFYVLSPYQLGFRKHTHTVKQLHIDSIQFFFDPRYRGSAEWLVIRYFKRGW